MATRIAARHRLGRLRARLALGARIRKLATTDLKAAVERWDNEGGALIDRDSAALVLAAHHPLIASGNRYGRT